MSYINRKNFFEIIKIFFLFTWIDLGHFYKKNFPCKYKKKFFINTWTDLGHFYKKIFTQL